MSNQNITPTQSGSVERVSKRPTVTPLVDIFENQDEVLVVADVPGASPDGVHLNFDKDTLSIEATFTGNGEKAPKLLFSEFGDTDYRRIFQLAPGIDVEKIAAELKEGVLTIHLPKSAALKPRKIPISVD